MEAYRKNYYNIHCDQTKYTWTASWHYSATVSHILSFIIFPLNIYVGYCIIYKSSNKMHKTKWPMLNLHVWTSFLDILVSTLATPYVFLPLFCGFSVGLLDLIDVPAVFQVFLIQLGLTFVGASLIVIFENRHNAIVNDHFKITRKWSRVAFYVFNYGMAFILLPIYFSVPDQESTKLRMLEIIPCPTPEFFDPKVFVLLDMSNTELIARLVQIQFGAQTVQGFFFVPRTVFYLMIRNPSLSETTRKLQRKVFKCICIQISIPMAVLVVPMLYMWLTVYFTYYNQALTNTLAISLLFHGISSALAITIIYEPYRTFTTQLIRRVFGCKQSVAKVSDLASAPVSLAPA